MIEIANALDAAKGGLVMPTGLAETITLKGSYTFECVAPDGSTRWREDLANTVMTVGKNDLLDKYFAGSSYTAAFYLALVDGGSTPTYSAADTMSSHSGWTENVGYSNSTRVAPTFNAAASGSKVTNATAFNINATGTIAGAFITTVSTKSGTTGILYSAGSFSASRSVLNGDTLNVTYTASV